MRDLKLRALLVIAVAALLTPAVSADSRRTKCNSNGKVFGFQQQYTGTFDVTLMWGNADLDADIAVFVRESEDMVAFGYGLEPRHETVTLGSIPGVVIDIVVFKASGPNATCYLYASDRDPGLVSASRSGPSGRGLRYRGSLAELAAQDPYYSGLQESIERLKRLKRR